MHRFFSIMNLLISLTFVSAAVASPDPHFWTENFAEAMKRANQAGEKRQILILFTGSDWCPPCMLLEKDVLSKSEFKEKIARKFIPVYVDKPAKTQLSVAQEKANASLAAKYSIAGYPTLLAIDHRGRVFGAPLDMSSKRTTEALIKALDTSLRGLAQRDQYFYEAAHSNGATRIARIDQGLSAIRYDERYVGYEAMIKEITGFSTDYKTKYSKMTDLKELNGLKSSGQFEEFVKKTDEFLNRYPKLEPSEKQLILIKKAQVLGGNLKKESEGYKALEAAVNADPTSEIAAKLREFLKDPEKFKAAQSKQDPQPKDPTDD